MQSTNPNAGLSKESLVVWTAWSRMGNREVIREAAAKGTHIDLAKQFLLTRKKVSHEDVETWFESEVLIWIKELLERKQIYRVQHILSNIKKDPFEELLSLFNKTESKEIRNYIGNHLDQKEKLDPTSKKLWMLSNIIINNYELVSSFISSSFSIKELSEKSLEWQSKIATTLFLLIYDFELIQFIRPLDFWKHLLLTNNVLIKEWIRFSFHNKKQEIKTNINPILAEFFKVNKINHGMLEYLTSSYANLSKNTKDNVLNELCIYGIILEEEKCNFLKFLKRLLKLGQNNLHNILKMNFSIEDQHLFASLLEKYCIKKGYHPILGSCFANLPLLDVGMLSKDLSFLSQLKKFIKDINCLSLKQNILNVINFISSESLEKYFENNGLIFLTVTMFTDNSNFYDVIDEKVKCNVESFEVNENFINSLMSRFCTLNIKKKSHSCPTVYDMLKRQKNIDSHNFFSLEKRNNLPHFSSSELVYNYGLKKDINHAFFVRALRPSFASKLFILAELGDNTKSSEDIKETKKIKIFKIALKHFNNKQILCSCISYCEMVGTSSEKIRIFSKVADILYKHHKEEYLSFNYWTSDTELLNIQYILEECVVKDIDFSQIHIGNNFLKACRVYEIVPKFSKINKIKQGELFLKRCAMNNQWLAFLIYVQIKCYPIEQIKEILPYFKSSLLLEHLYHCASYDIKCEDILMGERDSRNSFLSRVGVRKQTDLSYSDQKSSTTSRSSFNSDNSDFTEFDSLSTKATLLQTLIRCHNSVDPPKSLLQACYIYRYPLLAILATSYEPDSIHTNWITWLTVSCNDYHSLKNVENIVINPILMSNLLIKIMDHGYYRTLHESFEIFLPNNALTHFLDFLVLLVENERNSSVLLSKVNSFKNALKRTRRASIMPEGDNELMFLDSRIWIEDLSIQLMASALEENVKSIYEQLIFLGKICEFNFQEVYTIDIPNFFDIINILKLLNDSLTNTKINLKNIMNTSYAQQTIVACLEELIGEKLFHTALEIAKIGNLPLDLIVIKMWENKLQNIYENFWIECNRSLQAYAVTADAVVEFYLKCFEKIKNPLERYDVLNLCYEWAHQYELSSQYDLEQKIWIAYVDLDEKDKINIDLKIKPVYLPYSDILNILEKVPCFILEPDQEFKNKIEKVIEQALNKDNFFLALRLEKMFSCHTSDLDILKLCYNLAEGLLMPHQMSTTERMLLMKNSNIRKFGSNRRSRLSTRVSSYNSSLISCAADSLEIPVHDTLSLIQTLSEKLISGTNIATNVLMMYRVSMNIEIPFNIIIGNTDHMKILKNSLELDCMNKLEVIHDIILIYEWTKNEISDFICEELVNHISFHVKSKNETLLMWDLDINQDFHLVLQLLSEGSTILGQKLFKYASTSYNAYITTIKDDLKISEVAIVIELLIRAHDCFTSDCNMEGISTILNKCQSIVSHLVILRSWKYIVRLLTGIARYSEMNYVFQILKENDQFEFLLRKGSGKDNALKIALLAYLKKFCPDNQDLYKMVALHFALYSEVAQLWERDAQNIIQNLIGISKLEMQNNKINPDTEPFVIFTNTDGTRLCLKKAMENFTHATEFHLQGEKLAKAMNSAKQAELLAVQLSLFNGMSNTETAKCLLNLENWQIINLICTQLTNFEQALILVESYNFPADWATVLYEQCIILNNDNYLESFLNHLPLTDSLIRDIARKFLSTNQNTLKSIESMKIILNKIPSVHTKYQIASELGFVDVVEDLITKGQLAYLKDTVWKRGYKE